MASSLFFTLALSALLLFSYARADEDAAEEAEKHVLVLTEDNFKQSITENEHILVEFYAPWCGHCKSLAPEYESAAKQLAAEGSAIRLAMVDATVEKSLQEEFKVQGFPTLKFFVNGEPTEYGGGRTADTIISWVKKMTGPPAVALADVDAAKEFIGEREVVVIGLFADQESAAAKGFLKAARDAQDIQYGITSSAEVAKEYGIESEFGFVVLRTFDEPRVFYDSDNFTGAAISAFVGINSLPLVIDFTQESAPKIFSGKTPRQFLYFGSKKAEGFKAHHELLTQLAVDNKGTLLFVVFDTEEEENVKILDVFGLKTDALPAVRIIELVARDMKKFEPESTDLTVEALSAFIAGVTDGSIKITLKSEDVPEDWDAKPVKVVVGKNFHDVVINNEKNVIIEFYAPWCGHCKKLEPIWDELGEYFDGREEYVIAKMDATTNEVEGLEVSGFPTIKMFPAGDKSHPLKYTGKRDLKSLMVFGEGGGRDGGVPDADFPIPSKKAPEPDDFEAEDEEEIPLEETEEEKAIRAEAEAEVKKASAKEEL